jgi:hypothetical protein
VVPGDTLFGGRNTDNLAARFYRLGERRSAGFTFYPNFFQILKPRKGGEVAHLSATEGERLQGAETREGREVAHLSATEGERLQGAEAREGREVAHLRVVEGERLQGSTPSRFAPR